MKINRRQTKRINQYKIVHDQLTLKRTDRRSSYLKTFILWIVTNFDRLENTVF